MYYFQFHIGDYLSSTVHLSNEEDLAYRRLLDMYYTTEKPIPLDTQWVARRLRLAIQSVEVVLQDFFVRTADGYTNERCEQEIERFRALAERNKRNGALGGRPSRNPVGSHLVPSGNPDEPSRNPNHEPITINQEPVTKSQEPEEDAPKVRRLTCPEDVSQEVWSAYMAVRKAKRAPITDLALRANRREAAAAGLTLEQALTFCCEANWQAFNAQWWRDRTAKTSVGKQSALEARNAEVARRFLASQEDV